MTTPTLETDPQPPTPAPTVTDPYHPEANAETFNLDGYLAQFDPRLLTTSEGRQVLTRLDPMLFGMVYLRHHLTDPEGRISFADPHFEWYSLARQWVRPPNKPRDWRHAFIAPRDCAKTTVWYCIVPIWAAAHGHAEFVAAFADGGIQAEMHLATFRHEMQHNPLLRLDYPELATPARKPTGKTAADNEGMYIARSGFVFAARGINASSLGMKVGERRPDVLICDDIERDESSYSEYLVGKRLTTFTDTLLPLNERARVVVVGTVTRYDSLIHRLVRNYHGEQPDETAGTQWIADERFIPHYYPPIPLRPDGTERSIWPAKWPLPYLHSIRTTRSYKKNFDNNPAAAGGDYWTEDDYQYGRPDGVTFELLSLDPSKTTKATSDFAGLAIVGYAPARPAKRDDTLAQPAQCVVEEAWEVKLVGEQLRLHLLRVLENHPRIRVVLVEVNDGGEHWHSILHDLPVRIVTVTQTVPKEVRMANTLNYYQLGQVLHAKKLDRLEGQQCGFPRVSHDDIADAVGSAVERLLEPRRRAGVDVLHPR